MYVYISMYLFDLILINSEKKDYFKFLLVFIISFIILIKINNIFDNKNIFSIVCSIFITYLFIQYNLKNDFNQYKAFKKDIDYLNIDEYKYLEEDIDIIESISVLNQLRNINSTCYNKSLYNLNRFIFVYNKIINKNLDEKVLYDNLYTLKKIIINNLLACLINYKESYGIISAYTTNTKIITVNESKYLKQIDNLHNILKNYLARAKNKINNNSNDGNINIYSSFINDNFPEYNELNDLLFNKHYSIY